LDFILSCHDYHSLPPSDSRWTQQVILDVSEDTEKLRFSPGDHLAVLPANKSDLVSSIVELLTGLDDSHEPMMLMTLKEITTANGEAIK